MCSLLAVLAARTVDSLLAAEDGVSVMFGLDTVHSGDTRDEMANTLSLEEEQEDRREKSLLNTFPFILDQQHHVHHQQQQQQERSNAKTEHNPLFPFKTSLEDTTEDGSVSIEDFIVAETSAAPEEGSLDLNTLAAAASQDGDTGPGRKCVDKVGRGDKDHAGACGCGYYTVCCQVMMVEETAYDEVVTCDHSYDQRCHTSYVTSYVSQQQEECDENFRKVRNYLYIYFSIECAVKM